MVDSTRSGDVVDQCAARAAEFVVEDDASRECQEALKDALFDSVKGAGAVAFECEQVFAGPEDRLDALPDWGEVGPCPGSSLRRGRTIVASSLLTAVANSRPA